MLYNSSRSLDVVLLNHYDKLNKEEKDAYEIVGTCSMFTSKNVDHQTCINNACNIYAQQVVKQLKGRIVSDIAGNGDNAHQENLTISMLPTRALYKRNSMVSCKSLSPLSAATRTEVTRCRHSLW